jgi:hypothetical protein
LLRAGQLCPLRGLRLHPLNRARGDVVHAADQLQLPGFDVFTNDLTLCHQVLHLNLNVAPHGGGDERLAGQ